MARDYVDDPDRFGPDVCAAIDLLTQGDEAEGQESLTIIGPFADDGKSWLELHGYSVEQALALPEGRVRAVSGCSMGGMFDMGFCGGPNGDSDGALVSFGSCFFVISAALPILDAATAGRVSVRRFWNLVIAKGHLDAHNYYCLPGVEYGPIAKYWEQFPWVFGDLSRKGLMELDYPGRAEKIAETIKTRGYWMWMRPDRFPIGTHHASRSYLTVPSPVPAHPTSSGLIATLPPEILHTIVLHLSLLDMCSLARVNKAVYNALIGNMDARDVLAKAYMRSQIPWYLPHGEAELKWWHARGGDEAIGWEYLRRCYAESHSMKNRKRIWKAAESIEEECQKQEATFKA
ncbi:hypothetical protein FRC09_019081 [Ceratobasidium sp. 395]|nr:hypothetical protein FRC09_019081 [Ceratobasidium sp. 395]